MIHSLQTHKENHVVKSIGSVSEESELLTNLGEIVKIIDEKVNPIGRPAAVVFNSHITGLAVTRSLGRRGVPVIALDRDPKGYALVSRYVTVSGLCPNVLADEVGFIAFLCEIGKALEQPGVLFPTNDEWVLAVNRHRTELEQYFLFPFSGPEVVEPVLDKAKLYRAAVDLNIPIPRTWHLESEDLETMISNVPYPCILKPTEQRSFYEEFGEKAWRTTSSKDFRANLDRAQGHSLVVQEIVGQGLTDFYSVCSYIGRDGEPHGVFVGRKLEQYPPDFGTGCLVMAEEIEAIAERGVRILQAFGYQGISEVEFIYDVRDGQHKLLDINTRVWKWIGLPMAAGVDLPWLAYTDAKGMPETASTPRNGLIWIYAQDYIALRLAGLGHETASYFPEDSWAKLLAGRAGHIVDAVIDADDPRPAARMIQNLFTPNRYYCAC